MADISFLVFEDAQGFYRLEGDGPIKDRTRIDMTQGEADAWIEAHKPEVSIIDEEEEPEPDMKGGKHMVTISLSFESEHQAALFLEQGGLPALGVTLELTAHNGANIIYTGTLSTRLWDGCRAYVEEFGGEWTAAAVL